MGTINTMRALPLSLNLARKQSRPMEATSRFGGVACTLTVLEKICDGAIAIDQWWNIVEVGSKARGLLGLSEEYVVGKNFAQFAAGLSPTPGPRDDEHALELTLAGDRNGRFLASVANISTDGTLTYAVALRRVQDIASQARIAELERDLFIRDQLVETALSAICIIAVIEDGNRPSEIISVNPAFERITGFSAAEAIGKNPTALLDVAEISQKVAQELKTLCSSSVFREISIRRHDGTIAEIDLNLIPIKRNGETTHFVGMFNDVSDRKRSLQDRVQANRLQALGQLTSSVAHDFNNFIAIIQGNLEMVKGGENVGKFVDRAMRGCALATDLIKLLAAFSRKQILYPALVNAVDMATQLRAMIPGLLEQGIGITLRHDNASTMIMVDAAQLQSCILNLIINSRDAMPNGGEIVIAITHDTHLPAAAISASESRHGRFVRIAVADTGVGMPEHVRERALEPFYTTKAVGKGTGLGLSTVFGFVQQSGGAMLVESRQDCGTTVSLFFPMIDTASRPHAIEARL